MSPPISDSISFLLSTRDSTRCGAILNISPSVSIPTSFLPSITGSLWTLLSIIILIASARSSSGVVVTNFFVITSVALSSFESFLRTIILFTRSSDVMSPISLFSSQTSMEPMSFSFIFMATFITLSFESTFIIFFVIASSTFIFDINSLYKTY